MKLHEIISAPLTVAEAKFKLASALLTRELADDAWSESHLKNGSAIASPVTSALFDKYQAADDKVLLAKSAYRSALAEEAEIKAAKLDDEEAARVANGDRDPNDQHADVSLS